MLKYVVCLCKGCDGCCVFVCIVTRGAVSARVFVPAKKYVGMVVCMSLLHSCLCV